MALVITDIHNSLLAAKAFELMDRSLKELVFQKTPEPKQCMEIIICISLGLSLLQVKSVIHRDLHQADRGDGKYNNNNNNILFYII